MAVSCLGCFAGETKHPKRKSKPTPLSSETKGRGHSLTPGVVNSLAKVDGPRGRMSERCWGVVKPLTPSRLAAATPSPRGLRPGRAEDKLSLWSLFMAHATLGGGGGWGGIWDHQHSSTLTFEDIFGSPSASLTFQMWRFWQVSRSRRQLGIALSSKLWRWNTRWGRSWWVICLILATVSVIY